MACNESRDNLKLGGTADLIRPKHDRFQNIIGQEQIKEHLQNAISTGKVSHAYILNGQRGSGKKLPSIRPIPTRS